jgi:hypothetical protein
MNFGRRKGRWVREWAGVCMLEAGAGEGRGGGRRAGTGT